MTMKSRVDCGDEDGVLVPSPKRQRLVYENFSEEEKGGVEALMSLWVQKIPSLSSVIRKLKQHNASGDVDVADTMYGEKFITDKKLTVTDASDHHARLMISLSDLKTKRFLTRSEERILENKGTLSVKVMGDFSDKPHYLTLGIWYNAKKTGFSYALRGGWNGFKDENGLEANDQINVVAIRSKGMLCFAIHGNRRTRPARVVNSVYQHVNPVSDRNRRPRILPSWGCKFPRGAIGKVC